MTGWESEFKERMRSFGASQPAGEMSVSLKVRVASGCFHREHSPHAYALIDQELAAVPRDAPHFKLVEHESGPELLAWLGPSLGLAAAVVSLVVAIVQARRTGVQEGDGPSDPLELIIRRVDEGDTYREEEIARIPHGDAVDPYQIEALLDAGVKRLAGKASDPHR